MEPLNAKTFLEAIPALSKMTTGSHSEYICPICEKRTPYKQVTVFGMVRYVPAVCSCETKKLDQELEEAAGLSKKREIERKFSVTNMGSKLASASFDTFRDRAGSEEAFTTAKRYADEFPKWAAEGVLIWGEPGNGKSHLAASVFHAVRARGYSVVFQSVPELLDRLRRAQFDSTDKKETNELNRALIECDLLVLDDIGAEKPTDWVKERLFLLLDGRYSWERPVFYTSNMRLSELREQLGKRIYDRILENTLTVENKGSSVRRERAIERVNKLRED